MASSKKVVEVDIVTDAVGNGAQTTAAGIDKVGTAAARTNAKLKGDLEGAVQQLPVVGQAYNALLNPINAAGVAAAGLATIFAQKAGEAISLADQLQDLSGQYGVLATSIQRIGNVASDEGGSLEGVAAGLNFLNKSSQEAITKGGELEAAYGRLGITLDDLKGKNAEEIFMQVADGVAAATDRQRAYADVLAVAGRSAGSLFATLEKGSETIRRLGDAKGVFEPEDLARLAEANDQLAKLNNQLTIFAGKIAAAGLNMAESVQEVGGIETAILTIQGALSNLTGQNIDLTQSLSGLSESGRATEKFLYGMHAAAEEAAPSVAKVAEEGNKIDPAPAKALADGIDPIKAAATAAADALRELNAATNELGNAQSRLSRTQSENARAQIDLQLELGNITKEQAANAKANIANDERAARATAERAKVLGDIAAAEADLAAASSASNAQAVSDGEERVAILRQLLYTLDEINSAEASKGGAEHQKDIADLRKQTEEEITEEKNKQLAATQGALAAEQGITDAQNGRPSAPLQKSPIGPSALDQPIDLTQPTQPRDLGPELAPRNPPPPPPPPPVTPPQPVSPQTQQPGTESNAAEQIAAAIEQGKKALDEAVKALVEGVAGLTEKYVSGIKELQAAQESGGSEVTAAIQSATAAAVGKAAEIISQIQSLESQIANQRV